ncbi:DUF4831 family protein [Dysgonomonas sp. 25]|uniref:DUF4831 family protein n=1 Tax=Dysgonomonas sp. 25 TaxID=2302933 RepID=UPI0013D1B7B8|nr:DUF4831 family protein [Dysgonomonas sp. 25]NDV68689.1 DUF4831 family protein [Dysgonomonas sp. 25]
MKLYIFLGALLFAGTSLSAQNIVQTSAVKANDYGVTYSLPKTAIDITVSYTKTTRKAGDFYQYAERYLNITNPTTENEVVYTLDKIETSTRGIPDKDNSYLVEFRPNNPAAFVSLSEEGLICAINDDYTATTQEVRKAKTEIITEELPNPNTFLSEEILRAGSTAKQAELIAKQIYRLRESRTNILTGEADNMPPDGNAYKLVMEQLDQQEKALTAMFIGTEIVETGTKTFSIVPDKKNIDKEIIFRFSSKLGVVEANDLSGAPVYVSLQNKDPRPEVYLSAKEQQAMEKKFSKGLIYNIPNKAALKVVFNGKDYVDTECEVAQYGTQDVLSPNQLGDNKRTVKIIFYPELGSIKQIQ